MAARRRHLPLVRTLLVSTLLVSTLLVSTLLVGPLRPGRRQGLKPLGTLRPRAPWEPAGGSGRAGRRRLRSWRRARRQLGPRGRRWAKSQRRRSGRLRVGQRRDLGVFKPQFDDVGREHARSALGHEALHVGLAL